MKLLIIGKTGQLGSTLTKDALSLNHEVISPSRQELDISNISQFTELLNIHHPDIIINTAAFKDTKLCEEYPDKALKYNSIAVKNMAEISDSLNTQFITFSTDYVFDGTKSQPYVEKDNPHPTNIYGLSKLLGEKLSLLYDNTTVIRTCGLYGISSKNNNNFIDKRIEDSKHTNYLEISNDQTISPAYSEDLSKAVLQLIEHPLKSSSIYHLVNEGYCTWYELTKEIFNILNVDMQLSPINRHGKDGKMRRPLFSALKNTKAKELGIVLPHWKDALKRYLNLKYNV